MTSHVLDHAPSREMQIDPPPAVISHRASGVLTSLQAGRALAALAVVFHHANMSATQIAGGAPEFAQKLSYGTLGVDFFFVLSGFIIYYGTVDDEPDKLWVGRFLTRRAIRIFLPYWPIGIGLAILYTALPGFGGGEHQFAWLSTLTLLPADQLPALIPAWTLQHEVFFYITFAALMWLRVLWIGLALWAILLIVLWWPNGPEGNVVLASMNVEFVAGIIAAHLVQRDRVRRNLFMGCGISLISLYFYWGRSTNSLIFGVGIAFLVAWIAHLEREGLLRMPAFAVILGNASYAIYLIHNPLLAITTRGALYVAHSWWLAMVVGVTISVAAGLAYHFLFEKPALRLVRQAWGRRLTVGHKR